MSRATASRPARSRSPSPDTRPDFTPCPRCGHRFAYLDAAGVTCCSNCFDAGAAFEPASVPFYYLDPLPVADLDPSLGDFAPEPFAACPECGDDLLPVADADPVCCTCTKWAIAHPCR